MVNTTILRCTFLFALLLLIAPVIAVPAHAQGTLPPASIIKGGCNVLPGSFEHLFSVRNETLTRVCQILWTPGANSTNCPILDGMVPPNWSVTVNPDGSALFQAMAPASNCVQTGTTMPGFSIIVANAGNCCYYVEFLNASGALLYQTTRCCNCGPVSVDDTSWGRVKALYQ